MAYTLLERRADGEEYEVLREQVDAVVESLREAEGPDEWLEGVLDVRRYQRLVSGRWETDYYEFCVAWGGPTIYVRTNGEVEAYWGGKLKVRVEDEAALRLLREVEERLNAAYGSA